MKQIIILFTSILFIACAQEIDERAESTDNSETVDNTNLENNLKTSVKNNLAAYYELDDKYYSEHNTEQVQDWWNAKVNSILEEGFKTNLLTDEGGGPNGSQWNADAHLYIAAIFEGDSLVTKQINENNKNVHIIINKDTLNELPLTVANSQDSILIGFKLPRDIWGPALRVIMPVDLALLHDLENNKDKVFSAPLNEGRIITISVILESDSSIQKAFDFFHISFGE